MNEHMSNFLSMYKLQITVVTIGAICILMLLLYLDHLKSKLYKQESGVISRYKDKLKPLTNNIVSTINEICGYHMREAPWLMHYLADKIKFDIEQDCLLVDFDGDSIQMSNTYNCMLDLLHRIEFQQKELLVKNVDAVTSLMVLAHNRRKYFIMGKRTAEQYYKETDEMLNSLNSYLQKLQKIKLDLK